MALSRRDQSPRWPAFRGLFQATMAYKQAFHAYSAILDSFFDACATIVDSFIFS